MKKHAQWAFCAVVLGIAGSVTVREVQAQAAAMERKAPTAQARVTRLADGRPDLQGVWNFGSATPLERPPQFADKPVLTGAEAEAYLKNLPDGGCRFVKCDGSDQGKLESAYGDGWYDVGTRLAENRTSLIVDPPNGRVPPLTPEAQKKLAELRALDRAHQSTDPNKRRSPIAASLASTPAHR